jgi:hypothetical protein
MKHIKAPYPVSNPLHKPVLFLAGSIEQDTADRWQERVVNKLVDTDWVILNPRRDSWDSTWTDDSAEFKEQVNWELDGLEIADRILVYFDPSTKAPISLLELGLFADLRVRVVCPTGYWRKGNVDIVCQRYDLKQFDTLDDAVDDLKILMWWE